MGTTCCSCDNEQKEQTYDPYEGSPTNKSPGKSPMYKKNIKNIQIEEAMFSHEASTMVSSQSPIGTASVSLNEMIRLVRVQAMVRGFL